MNTNIEHPEAERADPYEKDVERVWRDSGKVYGARKIRHALGHEGVTLSRRRINRIMKGNGMAGSYSKAAYRPRPARPVFCQVGVGRFGVSFSPCERRVSGRFGVGRSCWLLVIALVIA